MTQLYNEEPLIGKPDPVLVKAGATTHGTNGALILGGYIEGKVTSIADGEPLSEVVVCTFTGPEFECGESGPEGIYRIPALPTGEYTIAFLPHADYLVQVSEEVPVVAGHPTTEINKALVPDGTIEGTVSTVSNVPIEGVQACAEVFNEGLLVFERCTTTASDGTYAIERLPLGAYYVQFSDEPLYPSLFFPGSASLAGATPVHLSSPGQVLGGINGTLSNVASPAPIPPAVHPVPAIAVLTSKSVIPLLTILGRLSASGRVATAKLHCGLGPCKGTLQLLVTVVKRHRVNGHTVTKHVTELLGTGSFSLAQGATSKAKIKLDATGRHLLANAAHHPHTAKLKVTLQGVHASLRAVVVG